MAEEAPDYAGIVARAQRGEYVRMATPPPLPRIHGVLAKGYWPFGKDLERYLEKAGIDLPDDATAITLRYEADDHTHEIVTKQRIRVTIKRAKGKKRRHYLIPPAIDNMESLDT